MFSRTLLIACVIFFIKMQATLGAVVVRSELSSTTLSSTAPATYHHGLMWKGYEHEVVGYGSSGVPQPTPTLNNAAESSVPCSGYCVSKRGKPEYSTETATRRDTNKGPRSPMPTSGRGYTWKGREHEEDT
ncbi:hypothetical protein BKA83DRAFT_4254317 [Pisolithus microcarpus]|nr:hypothetical protein BKA83DRAFT_4254317 [Pisolithus microcarpus]